MGKQGIQFPLTNAEFLKVISNSFKDFISSGTSRSTAKLKPLHGAIAKDIAIRLGDEYKIFSLGYEGGSETSIEGRYINKKVDSYELFNYLYNWGESDHLYLLLE